MDLGSVGPKFTWRGQESRDYGRVSERLDRGFVNQALRLKFPDLSIKVLSGLKSDHHLLLAELVPKDRNLQRPQRPFRFEAAWKSRTNFSELMLDSWEGGWDLMTSLKNLSGRFIEWNKQVFGNIFTRKKKVLSRLGGIQKAMYV